MVRRHHEKTHACMHGHTHTHVLYTPHALTQGDDVQAIANEISRAKSFLKEASVLL